MKRYVSVFEMIVRSSIYKILLVLLWMAATEGIALFYTWNQSLAVLQPNLEEWIDQAHLSVLSFMIGGVFVTLILSVSQTNIGSMVSYTLQRLRIPEKNVYVLQCIYNSLCYVLVWSVQVVICLISSVIYLYEKQGAIVTNQTVFLAFYKNKFLHRMLPMEDIFDWCMLVFFIVLMGISTATFSRRQRKRKRNVLSIRNRS